MSKVKTSPIGIFDSGIGGLTVAKAVVKSLPNEDIIYFGDTARVPYGIKSVETVKKYALEIIDFLLKKDVKMILIACNTVSASAKEAIIKAAGDVPVLDVISSGAETAFHNSSPKHIGVIGTLATVNSNAYVDSIHELNQNTKVSQQACPLLVPLAEEGWTENKIARETLEYYLEDFDHSGIDSLILGCTHYPLFKKAISEIFENQNVRIIDSAESIAETARQKLEQLGLLNTEGGDFSCYVSDRPQRFQELAERFLGQRIQNVEVVTLD